MINDEVGVLVNEAYKNIILAKESLRINDISNATIYAKLAFNAAETAFFYPSMLSLLYFPDDQKYMDAVFFNFKLMLLKIYIFSVQICHLHSPVSADNDSGVLFHHCNC